MQEREFRKLLDKYLKGTTSEKETELLDKFQKTMFARTSESAFKHEEHKDFIEKSLWSGIQAKLDKNHKKRKLPSWRIAASIAAVFMGLVTIGYLYITNNTTDVQNHIQENVVTLQLEDGSIKVIQNDGTTKIIGKNGIVLGQQKGNQLVYSETGPVTILQYNTLTVPYGKTFELRLSDGTKAHLNAGSSLKYPVRFLKGKERQIFVTGEVFLDVAKDSSNAFVVNSNDLNIRVLGTRFNVSAYPEDKTTEVVLVEGSVSLYSLEKGYDSEQSMRLDPGFKGSFNKGNNSLSKTEVITDSYTSWMKGELIFRNMTFGNILKKLERHYNITIINNNTGLTNKMFNANFGSEPIQNVLQELQSNYDIDYEMVNENTIMIR